MIQKLIVIAMLVAATGMLRAQEPAKDAELAKLGTLRLQLSVKLTELMKLTNNDANGINKAGAEFQFRYTTARNEINKRLQAESAKGDGRDQAIVDMLTTKAEKFDKLMAEQQQDWPVFNQAMGGFSNTANDLNSIFQNNLAAADQAWLRAGLDPAVLTATLEAVDKRTNDLRAQAAKLVEDYKKLSESRQLQFSE